MQDAHRGRRDATLGAKPLLRVERMRHHVLDAREDREDVLVPSHVVEKISLPKLTPWARHVDHVPSAW